MKELTSLEKEIYIHDSIYNKSIKDYMQDEKFKKYAAERLGQIKKHMKDNFFIYLNGFEETDPSYIPAEKEVKFIKESFKEDIYYSPLSLIDEPNKELKIPNNFNITAIIASHGIKDNNDVLIEDDLSVKRKPQDIIKKIRETLEYNIQDKKEPRDINIKFHACYGLLITQNKEAMKELENLSKVFPNARINLITEKFGSATFCFETALYCFGSVYPTISWVNAKTHSGIFLVKTEEEFKQSKERLIELFKIRHENTIRDNQFTIEDFISKNKDCCYVRQYENHNPKEAYLEYREDLEDKIIGSLIHLGISIKDAKQFLNEFEKNIIFNEKLIEFEKKIKEYRKLTPFCDKYDELSDELIRFEKEIKEYAKKESISFDNEYLSKKIKGCPTKDFNEFDFIKSFIEKYNFPFQQIPTPFDENLTRFNKLDEFNQELIKHEEYKKTWLQEALSAASQIPSTECLNNTSSFPAITAEESQASNNVSLIADIENKSIFNDLDNQKLYSLDKSVKLDAKSSITKRSNSAPRLSFTERLKDQKEKSRSQPSSKGPSL
ncbi:MAG: hypothetical protein U1E31_02195 [Rickettsiales bacterium]